MREYDDIPVTRRADRKRPSALRRRLPWILGGAALLTALPFGVDAMASTLPEQTLNDKTKQVAVISDELAAEIEAAPAWTGMLDEARTALAAKVDEARALHAEAAGAAADPAALDALNLNITRAGDILAADLPHDDLLHDEEHARVTEAEAALATSMDHVRTAMEAARATSEAPVGGATGGAASSINEGDPAAATNAYATDVAGPDGSGWRINVTGFCGDPSCAQAVVDTYDFSYIDYGTGFQTVAGHDWGPAGIIQQMNVGDLVTISGTFSGAYRITHVDYVPEGATTLDVAPGLALQTCMGDGSMTIKYLTAA